MSDQVPDIYPGCELTTEELCTALLRRCSSLVITGVRAEDRDHRGDHARFVVFSSSRVSISQVEAAKDVLFLLEMARLRVDDDMRRLQRHEPLTPG